MVAQGDGEHVVNGPIHEPTPGPHAEGVVTQQLVLSQQAPGIRAHGSGLQGTPAPTGYPPEREQRGAYMITQEPVSVQQAPVGPGGGH